MLGKVGASGRWRKEADLASVIPFCGSPFQLPRVLVMWTTLQAELSTHCTCSANISRNP